MTESRDPYAAIAEFYDLEHDAFAEDVEMYMQFAEAAGGPVLELACGTGRIAAPLAAAGLEVVGVDVSTAMLDRARRRHESLSANVVFIQADMRDATSIPGGPFGMVLLALGALNHVDDVHSQIATLQSARLALQPEGLLLIDVMHASPGRLYALDESLGLDGQWSLESGETVQRFSSHVVRAAEQLIESSVWYDVVAEDGSLSRHVMMLSQRYLSPGELLLMLEIAGFEDVTFYGGYELEPFDDHSDRLIAVARV